MNQLRSWMRRVGRWFVTPDQPREWLIEGDGRPLARLIEPRLEDTFWVRWRVVPFADAGATLFDPDLWRSTRIVFRDPRTGLTAPLAYSGGSTTPSHRDGVLAVTMRGLRLSEDEWRRLDGLP